eukprot:m.47398 g.47398  ORF g.47398 m.47398 type:complete len:314 (+) comp10496_c0_seq1:372-1313(+)
MDRVLVVSVGTPSVTASLQDVPTKRNSESDITKERITSCNSEEGSVALFSGPNSNELQATGTKESTSLDTKRLNHGFSDSELRSMIYFQTGRTNKDDPPVRKRKHHTELIWTPKKSPPSRTTVLNDCQAVNTAPGQLEAFKPVYEPVLECTWQRAKQYCPLACLSRQQLGLVKMKVHNLPSTRRGRWLLYCKPARNIDKVQKLSSRIVDWTRGTSCSVRCQWTGTLPKCCHTIPHNKNNPQEKTSCFSECKGDLCANCPGIQVWCDVGMAGWVHELLLRHKNEIKKTLGIEDSWLFQIPFVVTGHGHVQLNPT